jgi:CheY-like chemotaxis protein
VSQIKLASQRAADLTQQMLAYSGRCRFLVQPVDLNALIREMHQLLSASIDKTATVHYQLAPELPSLMADATQLRQVVMNLLTNAAEAIGETGGAIAVRTALLHADQAYLARANLPADLPPGDYIMLSVSDTGSGMAPATIAKIFDPFFTTKFTGRGLGLAAVQGIVRGHRGALKVQSTLGSGATFTILLPTTPVAEPQPSTGQIHRRPSDRSWHGQGTVLVVDDESTVRTTAARALERFGFQVLLASNGSVGVELFRRYVATISYVLLDLTMPHMNGEQALHVMRAIDPAARIIIMSGYDEQEVLTRFSDVALDGFLHKPFLPDQLQAALQRGAQPSAA